MFSDIKQKLIQLAVLVAVCAIAFGAGYWSRKPEVKTVTKIETVEKIVEKKVAIADKSVTEKTVTKPDGTVEKTIQRNDISAISVDSTVDRKVSESKTETKTTVVLPRFSVGGQALMNYGNPKEPPRYNAVVGYRVLGTVWAEGIANMKKDIGLGVRIELP